MDISFLLGKEKGENVVRNIHKIINPCFRYAKGNLIGYRGQNKAVPYERNGSVMLKMVIPIGLEPTTPTMSR